MEVTPERTVHGPVSSGGVPPVERRRTRFTVDRTLRILFTVAVVVIVFSLLWYFSALVIYLAIGIILAYLLGPLVDRVQGIGVGRIVAILFVFAVVLGGLSLLITFLVPFVARQVSGVTQLISLELIEQAAETIDRVTGGIVPQSVIMDSLNRGVESLFQDDLISRAVDSVFGLFANLFYALLVIPFVTFFFLKDGNRIRHSIFWFVPNRYFEITVALAEKIEINVGRYFRALLLQCTAVASVASVLLLIVGLDYAVAVGIFTGLANMIPYLGPLMGFLAGTMVSVAQTGDGSLVLGVLVAMALTQISDNVFFQPLIFARAAKAHPIIILFVVLIGAQLAGIVGMLLAIPVTATFRVALAQILWSVRNYRILRAE